MNFGQRYLELNTTYTQQAATGLVTVHVSQMPPNANIFQPGPAMIFLVVDGVPSQGQVSASSRCSGCWLTEGQMIVIGTGNIEMQPLAAATVLPTSSVIVAPSNTSTAETTSAKTDSAAKSGAPASLVLSSSLYLLSSLFILVPSIGFFA